MTITPIRRCTMSKQPLDKLDGQITHLKKELQNAERLREIMAESPGLAALFIPAAPALNGESQKNVAKHRRARVGLATEAHLNAIVAYFKSVNNAWKKKNEIASGTKLAKNQVTHILYKKNPELFERKDSPDSKLVKVWRLCKEAPEEPTIA